MPKTPSHADRTPEPDSGRSSRLTVEKLDVQIHPDTPALARAAADEAASVIRSSVAARGAAHVMFATGNSQLAFVDALTAGTPEVPWSDIVVFHMDEYVGVGPDHPAGFQRWIRERIVDRVRPRQAYYLDGLADPERECERYARLLVEKPLDLCCLGIGENGHLAFNDPPFADFDDPADVKVVDLDEASRRQQVHEGHFRELGDVPRQAVTVTIPALLRANRVLAVVPEERKSAPVAAALQGPLSTTCPASILRTKDNVTLHLDAGSASKLELP